MANSRRKLGPVLDVELQTMIDTAFAEYEKYLRTPQDVAHYRRKRKEYWDSINAALKCGGLNDGVENMPEVIESDGCTADSSN